MPDSSVIIQYYSFSINAVLLCYLVNLNHGLDKIYLHFIEQLNEVCCEIWPKVVNLNHRMHNLLAFVVDLSLFSRAIKCGLCVFIAFATYLDI